jgi:hypothetical protein
MSCLAMAALLLVLGVTPTWGAPPNPTDSDATGNTAGGDSALSSVTVNGVQNTAFGAGALQLTTTGDNNTAVGYNTLILNTGGDGNTASGFAAMNLNTTGSYNTAAGFAALQYNTTGTDNTASGSRALFNNVDGGENTASGVSALFGNTSGDANTASGAEALYANTTGGSNTASGAGALRENTTGSFNTAGGYRALYYSSGDSNTASGAYALYLSAGGGYNTAAGSQALLVNGNGARNTAVGFQALKSNTGHRNIAVGYQAGSVLESGNQNIYLGHPGAKNESKTLRLGSAQTRTFVAGVAEASVNGASVLVTPSGRLGVQLSSARYKEGIEPLGAASDGVHRLRPVTFVYRDDEQRLRQYGLIAEEVAAVYPELVTRTEAGQVQAVRYQELIPLLLNELQQQQRALLRHQQELAELRALVRRLAGPGGAAGEGATATAVDRRP